MNLILLFYHLENHKDPNHKTPKYRCIIGLIYYYIWELCYQMIYCFNFKYNIDRFLNGLLCFWVLEFRFFIVLGFWILVFIVYRGFGCFRLFVEFRVLRVLGVLVMFSILSHSVFSFSLSQFISLSLFIDYKGY